jgi:hypothetical protein
MNVVLSRIGAHQRKPWKTAIPVTAQLHVGMAHDPAEAALHWERLLLDRLRVMGPDHVHTRDNLS